MPTLYDIDFNQQAIDFLPPDKRDNETIALVQSLLKSLQWNRDSLFGSFKTGATATNYSPGLYHKYDQVIFNKALYEALKDTVNDPTTNDWFLVQPNFIGMDERIKYNGQKIVLEYALNKEFNGVFRQPVTGLNSDIYLTNIAAVLSGFRVGEDETGASSIGSTTASDSIGGNYPFVQVNNFQINIPTALYAVTNEKAIRNFVDKYIPISLNYIIQTY